MTIYPPKPPKQPKKELGKTWYIVIGLISVIFAVGVLTMDGASAYATYKAGSLVVLGIACIIYGIRRK